jgi:hypothetical protein
LSIRVFMDRSGDEALLIDYDLGAELYDRIQAFKLQRDRASFANPLSM